MIEIVEGIFRGGHVELTRIPSGAEDARVLVTFLSKPEDSQPSDADLDDALRHLVNGMMRSKMTGGRGYLNREELYGERLTRYDR